MLNASEIKSKNIKYAKRVKPNEVNNIDNILNTTNKFK